MFIFTNWLVAGNGKIAGAYFHGASLQGHTTSDHQLIGCVVATILVIVVTVQIALDTAYWTVFNHITVWGSLVWYFVLQYFYNFVIGGSYVGSLTKVYHFVLFVFFLSSHSHCLNKSFVFFVFFFFFGCLCRQWEKRPFGSLLCWSSSF